MPVAHLRFEYVPRPDEVSLVGRRVLCARSSPLGQVCAVVHAHEDGETAFTIVNLGSVTRVGEDRRAIPVALIKDDPEAGCLVVRCDAEAVRNSPIYVEGPRCDCAQWLERVLSYYASL
jgi:hypothetical protein